jgi:hypothetical protein
MRYAKPRVNQSYRVTNPIISTGIAQAIVAAWAATTPIMVVFNADVAGGVSLHLDYIKLINAAAGASTTSAHSAYVLDTVDRWSAGGTRLTTGGPFNVNSALSQAPKARIDFGAVTATAATAPRQVGRDMVKTQAAPCWSLGDEVYAKFDTFDFSPAPTSGAGTAIFGIPSGPVVIAPGHSFLFYLWNIANAVTPPSWEIEMAWWEGPGAS